jgi:hypothetical protein
VGNKWARWLPLSARRRSPNELLPGDLAVWDDHVAMIARITGSRQTSADSVILQRQRRTELRHDPVAHK